MSAKITAEHLERQAIVYVRQSTAAQLEDHPESRRRQYALADKARALGFRDVEVIDEDLGRSGGPFAERPGFTRLMSAVCLGGVGAVLALESSRLARNDPDWSRLVAVGTLCGVLLVDYDGVYDPRLPNDRLMLGLKGLMSQHELATLHLRAHEALRAKAARGELRLHLPAGLSYDLEGRIVLEPDLRVQQAIRLAFAKFEELGSVRQVMLWFRREELQLPVSRLRKRAPREILWAVPSYQRVHAVIINPLYAGVYVFGRSEKRTVLEEGRVRQSSGHAKPIERWEVLIRDHHPGYIEWESFLRNQAALEENAFMKPGSRPKAGRGGRSLLTGLLRCRRCGHLLQVHYGGRDSSTASFQCRRRQTSHGDEACISVGGKGPEQAVSEQVLRAVERPALEAALEAAKLVEQRHSERRQALVLELEQARYEANLAARRYDQVDPEQRLVAAELEARWNAALERVVAIESRLSTFDSERKEARPLDLQRLRALADNLPNLWNAPETDMRLKQRIVRLLIREIIADVDDQTHEVVLTLHWQGGQHSEVRVRKKARGLHTEAQAVALVTQMAGRYQDALIATALNRIGARTATGKTWNTSRVSSLRSRLGLPSFNPERCDPSRLTCKDAAARLGLHPSHLAKLLAQGRIPGRQVAPGAPWEVETAVLDTTEVQALVRSLTGHSKNSKSKNNTPMIPGL